jgi:hypothetical protein
MVSGLESDFESENATARGEMRRRASSRKGRRRQPTEKAPRQATAVVEHDAGRDGLAILEHVGLIAHKILGAICLRYHRHCERSEAIHSLLQQLRDGLLRRKCSSQ